MRKTVTPITEWTVEMHRIDRRRKDGMVLVLKEDFTGLTYAQLERMYPQRPRYIVFIKETYVERRNAMTGELFRERYDTPWTCSPASETYWSS